MKTKKPLVLRIELALFYMALASFSLGILLQQIVLHLFALFQLGAGLIYGLRLGTLVMRGRRMGMLFFVVTTACAVVGQQYYPSEDATRIHWAIASYWVIAPAIVLRCNWNTLYKVVIVCTIPGMLYSIYWLSRPDEIVWAMDAGFEHYPRAFGFLSNPITYAEGLVIIGGWTLSRLHYTQQDRQERKWMKVHLGLSVLIVLFSRVRAGLVGFVVLFLVNALATPRFRKVGILLCVTIPIAFLLTTSVFGFNVASLQERLDLAGNSVELFVENPIFGIGPNKYNREINGELLTQHPHNTLLGTLTEFGVLGLLAYLAFMVTLALQIRHLLRRYRGSESPLNWVVHALLFTFISFHLFGIFDYNYADTELLIMHALHWGIISHLAAHVTGGDHPPNKATSST